MCNYKDKFISLFLGLLFSNMIQNPIMDDEKIDNCSVDNCPICQDSLECVEENTTTPLPLRTLPCNHVFHRTCIEEWINLRNLCPICRKVADETKPVLKLDTDDDMTREMIQSLIMRDMRNSLGRLFFRNILSDFNFDITSSSNPSGSMGSRIFVLDDIPNPIPIPPIQSLFSRGRHFSFPITQEAEPLMHEADSSCFMVQCSYCKKSQCYEHGSMQRCGHCHQIRYCNRECQRADWPNHKSYCESVREEQKTRE